MSVPVLSWLFGACRRPGAEWTTLRQATSLRRKALGGPTRTRPGGLGLASPASDPPAFEKQPDRPSPQSQSFSRSYGSFLPTSLTYIVLFHQRLLTSETCCGYGYDGVREHSPTCPPSDFQGPSGAHRTPPQVWRYAGNSGPISGQSDSRGTLRREEKTTLPGAPADVSEFGCVAAAGRGRLRTPVREC